MSGWPERAAVRLASWIGPVESIWDLLVLTPSCDPINALPSLMQALLRFVCEMAQQLASPRQAGRVAMSFYAVVLCEFLAAVKTVSCKARRAAQHVLHKPKIQSHMQWELHMAWRPPPQR